MSDGDDSGSADSASTSESDSVEAGADDSYVDSDMNNAAAVADDSYVDLDMNDAAAVAILEEMEGIIRTHVIAISAYADDELARVSEERKATFREDVGKGTSKQDLINLRASMTKEEFIETMTSWPGNRHFGTEMVAELANTESELDRRTDAARFIAAGQQADADGADDNSNSNSANAASSGSDRASDSSDSDSE
jgi:hypothetical protein